MSSEYRIAETESFGKKIERKRYEKLYTKIKTYIYPFLRKNPYYGPNIKRLKGEYSDVFRFRVGDYRLFYMIDDEKSIVFILDIEHRKDAYK